MVYLDWKQDTVDYCSVIAVYEEAGVCQVTAKITVVSPHEWDCRVNFEPPHSQVLLEPFSTVLDDEGYSQQVRHANAGEAAYYLVPIVNGLVAGGEESGGSGSGRVGDH